MGFCGLDMLKIIMEHIYLHSSILKNTYKGVKASTVFY
jgi:hypothetical protein